MSDSLNTITFSSNGPVTASNVRVVEAHSHRLVRPCPVCGLIGGTKLHEQHFVGHPRQDIKQCSCGMIYADSGLTQSDYDAMYRERSKYAGEFSTGSEWEFGRKRLRHTVSWLSCFVKPDTSILDYGCATGDLLNEFHASGYSHLFGYDASPACQEALRTRGMTSVDPEGQKYGCVVLSHVLEHIYDVEIEFRRIVALVDTSAIMYIEVPDAASYRAVSPYQEFNTEHVNHFTLASLCALAGRHNLVPLHIGTKQFEVGDHVPYTAIFAIFRKLAPVDLSKYVEASDRILVEINEHLRVEVFGPGFEEIAIWGAGQLTLKLLNLPWVTQNPKLSRVRLFDSNQSIQGTKIGNLTVEAPQPCQCPILIGSILNAKSIEKSIRERGFTNKLIFLDSV